MNKMTYRDYTARIEYDEQDRIFVGHIAGIEDIVGFHGASVDELEGAFHEAVDDYIAIGEKTGQAAQKPYSGTVTLRIGPEVHAATAIAAQVHGKSMNQWAKDVLEEAARQ